MEIKAAISERMIRCRMIRPKVYRRLEKCEECEHFGSIKELSPANEQNGIPAQHVIDCKLPTEVLIENLIEEA